jgi:hypothetical protein
MLPFFVLQSKMDNQTLYRHILTRLRPHHFRHENQEVYVERSVNVNGQEYFTKSWTRMTDILGCIFVVIQKEETPELWSILCQQRNKSWLVKQLVACNEPDFPRLELNPQLTAWRNGWYFSGVKEQDISSLIAPLLVTICCGGLRIDLVVSLVQQYTVPLHDLFVPYDRLEDLPRELNAAIKFFDQPFRQDAIGSFQHQGVTYRNFMDVHLPLDAMFYFQGYTEWEVKLAYALLGGLQHPDNERKVILALCGVAGSGKSSLLSLCTNFYEPSSLVVCANYSSHLLDASHVNVCLVLAPDVGPHWNIKAKVLLQLATGHPTDKRKKSVGFILACRKIPRVFLENTSLWMNHLVVLDFPHLITFGLTSTNDTMVNFDRFYRKCALANYFLGQVAKDNETLWSKCLADTRFVQLGSKRETKSETKEK